MTTYSLHYSVNNSNFFCNLLHSSDIKPKLKHCILHKPIMTEGFATADKSKSYIALNSIAEDRGYKNGEATATCLCGAVQLAFVSLTRILHKGSYPTTGSPLSFSVIHKLCPNHRH